eukprot:591271-Rhodomonas_salina.1
MCMCFLRLLFAVVHREQFEASSNLPHLSSGLGPPVTGAGKAGEAEAGAILEIFDYPSVSLLFLLSLVIRALPPPSSPVRSFPLAQPRPLRPSSSPAPSLHPPLTADLRIGERMLPCR